MKRILLTLLSAVLFLHANEEDYLFSGKHFLASYLECDRQAIGNLEGMLNAMDQAVRASGATVLSSAHYVFPPNGVTVVYLLSESHASLHTYPEHGACFVDLFTCGSRPMAEKFDAALRTYLQPKEVNARMFSRDEAIGEIAYDGPAIELPTIELLAH